MLIAFTGPKKCGKTTAAKTLRDDLAFKRLRFAGAIKEMCAVLLRRLGYEEEEIENRLDGDNKEKRVPELGVTARHMMQTLGSEWGRDHVRPDLWAKVVMTQAKKIKASVVIDDCRFPNEAKAVRENGGHVVRIVRPGLDSSDSHRSEQRHLDVQADHVINNDKGVEEFRDFVRQLPKVLTMI